MVQFNFSERTIKAKVVYYGPAQSGKTTNLEQIHRLTDPAGNNRLISLNTAQDRTLFFDLLPFSLGAVAGYDFKVQLYTVPGQVQYNATRRVVLAGADAVVFVADGRKSMVKENQAAFENMKVNLLANRLVPEKVPLVFQYNKQDLPDLLPADDLTRMLNPWGRPVFAAVASQGRGVVESFVAVVQEMLSAIAIKYNLKEKGLDPAVVPEVVQEAFSEVLKQAGAVLPSAEGPLTSAPSPQPARVVLSQYTDSLHAAPPQAAPDTGLVSEELLHRSIRSNVELAEALTGLVREMNLGLGAILSHSEMLLVYREDAREKRQAAIASIQKEAGRLRRIVQDLGAAGTSPGGAGAPPPARPASVPPPRPAPPEEPPVRPAPPPAPPPDAAGFLGALQDILQDCQAALDANGVAVDHRVLPGTPTPTAPADAVRRALGDVVQGVAATAAPGTRISLRCERKPVLLRSREGEVKRDFLMFALAHTGSLSADEQQRIVQGADAGVLGQATRSIRDLGGFVRFAPLPEGALEARVFLPLG